MARKQLGTATAAAADLITRGEVQALIAAAGGGGGAAASEALAAFRPPVGGYVAAGVANANTSALTNGDLRLGLHYLPPGTYDLVAGRIQTPQTGGLVKFVGYNVATNGAPGSLAFETVAADASVGGFFGITLPSALVVGAGGLPIFAGAVSQGTSGVALWTTVYSPGGAPKIVGSGTQIDLADATGTVFSATGVTGAAPTTPTGVYVSAGAFPVRLAFRRSA